MLKKVGKSSFIPSIWDRFTTNTSNFDFSHIFIIPFSKSILGIKFSIYSVLIISVTIFKLGECKKTLPEFFSKNKITFNSK